MILKICAVRSSGFREVLIAELGVQTAKVSSPTGTDDVNPAADKTFVTQSPSSVLRKARQLFGTDVLWFCLPLHGSINTKQNDKRGERMFLENKKRLTRHPLSPRGHWTH